MVVFRKDPAPHDTFRIESGAPGTWWHELRDTSPGTICFLACPRCGKAQSMTSRIHRVGWDGSVSPSYVCAFPPCAFHTSIRLEGWAPRATAGSFLLGQLRSS